MPKNKEKKKIEFKITYCRSKQWQLMLGIKNYTQKTIYFYLSDFLKCFNDSVLLLYDENDIPLRKYYLGLRHDGAFGIKMIIEDFKKTILKRYEPVVEIYLESHYINIYSKDLKNILTSESSSTPFFFLPVKNRDFDGFNDVISFPYKHFTNVFFKKDYSETKYHIKDEYIGYTGKTKEELKLGREILCKIYMDDSNNYLKKYIYLNEIDIFSFYDHALYEYYFIKENTTKQILLELNSLIAEINEFKLIIIDVNFFDSNNLTEKMKLEKSSTSFLIELKSVTRYEVDTNKKLVSSTFEIGVYKKKFQACRLESRGEFSTNYLTDEERIKFEVMRDYYRDDDNINEYSLYYARKKSAIR